MDESNGLLPDDRLTIFCEVRDLLTFILTFLDGCMDVDCDKR